MYILMTDIGFEEETGFKCLEKLRSKFEARYTEAEIEDSKMYGLNKDFEYAVEGIYVIKSQ